MSKQLTEEQIAKRRASQKEWYQKNREKKLAYCKNRYKEKSTEILAQQAIYRANNKNAINARARQIYREFTLTNPQNNNL